MPGGLFDELTWRGMVHQSTDPELATKLEGQPFTAYVGFDATADSLHVGHLVGIVALQRVQRAGHRPIAVLGGGTSLIGDPSFKAAERPLLSEDQIEANASGIKAQLERFFDMGSGPAAGMLLDNSEWLCRLTLTDFLRDVGRHFSINAMVARDSVRSRLTEREQGISYTEFSYALLQAYDFLHLLDIEDCRLQLGGSDQWGNITAGIDLIRRSRRVQAFGLTWPLLTKADGTKFGKSESGNIWLDPLRTSPYAFYQFWFRTDDADVGRYLRLLTSLSQPEILALEDEMAARPQERGAQRELARAMTTAVHGASETVRAEAAARSLFEGDLVSLDAPMLQAVFAEAPSSDVPRPALDGAGLGLVELLVASGLVGSRTAARTAITQGAAWVNGTRQTDVDRRLTSVDLLADTCIVLRRGKRDYHLVRVT